MQVVPNAKSYATRKRAKAELEKHVDLNKVRWLIIAQEDGRFTAAVIGMEHIGLSQRNIAVIN